MNALDLILSDWWHCAGDEAVLTKEQMSQVLTCASSRIQQESSSTPVALRLDALTLLAPGGTDEKTPLLSQLLCASGPISFLQFWKAFQELWRRLVPAELSCDEPIMEELVTFRDGLLRQLGCSFITQRWLAFQIAEARGMSSDMVAWDELDIVLAQYSSESLFDWKVVGGSECEMRLQTPSLDEHPLSLEDLSSIILAWLRCLVDDYCRGDRHAKRCTVEHVVGRTAREACFYLGARAWDIEAALLSFYGGVELMASDGWSSGGAKLRRAEIECPICAQMYSGEEHPIVTGCCFQSLCGSCHHRLSGGDWLVSFQCPFCRAAEQPKLHRQCGITGILGPGGFLRRQRESAPPLRPSVLDSAARTAGRTVGYGLFGRRTSRR